MKTISNSIKPDSTEKVWEWVGNDYSLAYCEGDDPRIVAIIQREEYIDNDPTEWCGEHAIVRYGWSWRDLTARGCQCGDCADSWGAKVTEVFIRAVDEFGDHEWAERYLRIFWDAEVQVLRSLVDHRSNAIIFVKSDGTESADRETMQAWLDGDVYDIGYAVKLDRSDHNEDIDLSEWEVTMDSWGYFGEDYAKEMALPLADKEQADACAALDAGRERRHEANPGPALDDDMSALQAEVRRLWAMELRVRKYAHSIRYIDGAHYAISDRIYEVLGGE